MRKNILSCLLSLAIATVATSCVEYDAEPFTGHKLPRVTGYKSGVTNDWLYYNLNTGTRYNAIAPNRDIKEGEQITNEDVAMDWDIAFCGFRLRTNSGTSGIGNGGAVDLGYGDYDKWTSKDQVMNLEFTPDNDTTVYIVYSTSDWSAYLVQRALNGEIKYEDFDKYPWFDPNRGPQQMLTSANPVLANAMSFSGPPPVYSASFHTYGIRSADGERYYKFQLISWYDANVQIGDEGGELSFYLDELP